MVPKVSSTLRALHEIRDEVKELRTEVKEVREGLAAVEQRQTRTDVRVATELGAVSRTLIEVRDLLRDRLDDHRRVDEHEHRIQALERTVGSR